MPKYYQAQIKQAVLNFVQRIANTLESNCSQFQFYKNINTPYNQIFDDYSYWNQQGNIFVDQIKTNNFDQELEQYLKDNQKDIMYLNTYHYNFQHNSRQHFNVLSPKSNLAERIAYQTQKKLKQFFRKQVYDDEYIKQTIFPEHIIYSLLISSNKIVQELQQDTMEIFQFETNFLFTHLYEYIFKIIDNFVQQLDIIGCINLHIVLRKIPIENFSLEVMQLMNKLLRVLQSKIVFMIKQQVTNIFKINIDTMPSTQDFYRERIFKNQNPDELQKQKEYIINKYKNDDEYKNVLIQRFKYLSQSIANFDQTFYVEYKKIEEQILYILGNDDTQ